jgi:hypothetical protein
VYICNCPNEGCEGTVRVAKPRDLDSKCKKCAIENRQIGNRLTWELYTNVISEAKVPLALANPHLFIREEIASSFKNKMPYKLRKAILKCPTLDCINTVTIKYRDTRDIQDIKCKKCSDIEKRKRPYERTYNRSIYGVTLRNKKIKWLMSYEEFAYLCKIPNCHYCNQPLNRAEYAADDGLDSLLLDRKDSNKDYSLDNCVPCCPKCNFTKNDRVSYDEMVLVMKHRGCWIENEGYYGISV